MSRRRVLGTTAPCDIGEAISVHGRVIGHVVEVATEADFLNERKEYASLPKDLLFEYYYWVQPNELAVK